MCMVTLVYAYAINKGIHLYLTMSHYCWLTRGELHMIGRSCN